MKGTITFLPTVERYSTNKLRMTMNLLDRLLSDAARVGATVVTEQVNPSQVRVLAESRDASRLLCRLLAEPCGNPRAEKAYQAFIGELSA